MRLFKPYSGQDSRKSLKREVDDQKHEGKNKIAVKEEFLFIPFSHNLFPRELLGRLQEGCHVLRSNTSSLTRSQLERKIL